MDYTDQDEVTVAVGAGGDGLAFDPAAIRITPARPSSGEWTGQGGARTTWSPPRTPRPPSTAARVVSEEGATFEQSFDNTGIQLYYCTPHQSVGMLGAIQVVEA